MFASVLGYGLEIWGHSHHVAEVLVEQKKAVRVIAGLPPRSSCKPAFVHLRIMTAPSVYIFKVLQDIHKVSGSMARRGDHHGHMTRGRDVLSVPFARLNSTAVGKTHVQLYNKCPDDWKQSNQRIFKKSLKTYLIETPLYDIKEFSPAGLPR